MQRARTDEAKEQRRLALLEAALGEFFDRGFSAARMEDIAERAGCSKGTLYLYFPSKEALFEAIITRFAIPNIERLESTLESTPSAVGALTAITRMAPFLLRNTPVPKIVKVLIGESGTFPSIVESYRTQVVERGLSAIARMLTQGHERGEFVITDPHLTARLVIAPMVLSAIWLVVFETPEHPVDLTELFALHRENLLASLRPKEVT